MSRKSKLISLEEAALWVKRGDKLSIGGMLFYNRPSAFVHQLVKRGLKGEVTGLALYSSPLSSYDADLLMGAGLVKTSYLCHVSFEYLGFAPNYRKTVERGEIEVVESDEAFVIGGYKAAIEGLPYHPISSWKGTDLLKVNKEVKWFTSQDGEKVLMVPAISPDIGVIHAQEGDEYGNIRHLGACYADQLIAKASKKVIVTVDRLISHSSTKNNPKATTIPGYLVDGVVEVPYGAHPASSHTMYIHDEKHLRDYIQRAEMNRKGTDPAAFSDYLRKYILEPSSHWDYLERIGGIKKLEELREKIGL